MAAEVEERPHLVVVAAVAVEGEAGHHPQTVEVAAAVGQAGQLRPVREAAGVRLEVLGYALVVGEPRELN